MLLLCGDNVKSYAINLKFHQLTREAVLYISGRLGFQV